VKSVKSKRRSSYHRRRSTKNQGKWLPWIIGTCVVLLVGLLLFNSLRKPGTDEPGPRSYEALFGIQGTSYDAGETEYVYPDPGGLGEGKQWLPALGDVNAPVTIIEFSDIFCSHCRTFNLTHFEGILDDYVSKGKVRYIDHFYGFANTLETGAVDALMCAAEQGHYFELKHTLFQSIEVNAFDVNRAARISGLEMSIFNECMESGRYKAAIQEMIFEDNMGVYVTPTFFINGNEITGNRPDEIKQAIEDALLESH
jgi:predicted DsbA family dithiol-disulfide isomerase